MTLPAKEPVEVAKVKTAVEAVVAPIGVELMVPPEMVRLLSTPASASEPVSEGVKVWVLPLEYNGR